MNVTNIFNVRITNNLTSTRAYLGYLQAFKNGMSDY